MDRVMPVGVRGEVWDADFDPVRGREQAGRRPALIVSANRFNQGRSQLVSVAPITSRDRGYRLHVAVLPPEGGLSVPSFVMCEQVRVFSVERLIRRRGAVGTVTLAEVEARLRLLFEL